MNGLVRIVDVAEINPPFRGTRKGKADMKVTFLPMASLSEQGVLTDVQERPLNSVLKGYSPFQTGDVLIAKISPSLENGKAAFVERLPHRWGFGSTEFHVLRPSAQILGRYLFYSIWSSEFRRTASRHMIGTAGQKRVPPSFVGGYRIRLPSISEQIRIVEIIDKAEAIRKAREQCLALSRTVPVALFVDCFGDPMRNPRGYPMESIGNLGSVITGKTPPRSNPSFYGSAIEWIKSDNIRPDILGLTKASEYLSATGAKIGKAVPSGSILVACIAGSRESIGRVALTDRSVAFNQQINAIVPDLDKINPYFLYVQLLAAKRLIQGASTSGMKGMVTKNMLSAIKLMRPPKSEQDSFGAIYRRAWKLQRCHALATEEAQRIVDAMVSRMGGGLG